MGDGFFSMPRSGGSILELRIEGFLNPASSKPTEAFVLDILTPEGLPIDRVISQDLFVKSKCDYPCKDCDESKPSVCTACNTEDLSPLLLL
jgi:hypothetical protein